MPKQRKIDLSKPGFVVLVNHPHTYCRYIASLDAPIKQLLLNKNIANIYRRNGFTCPLQHYHVLCIRSDLQQILMKSGIIDSTRYKLKLPETRHNIRRRLFFEDRKARKSKKPKKNLKKNLEFFYFNKNERSFPQGLRRLQRGNHLKEARRRVRDGKIKNIKIPPTLKAIRLKRFLSIHLVYRLIKGPPTRKSKLETVGV